MKVWLDTAKAAVPDENARAALLAHAAPSKIQAGPMAIHNKRRIAHIKTERTL